MKIYAFEMSKSMIGGIVSLIIIRELINEEKPLISFDKQRYIAGLHNARSLQFPLGNICFQFSFGT